MAEVLRIGSAKGWIDNQGILQSLLSKVEQAQQRQDNGKQQFNVWNAFESEVRAQSGKHINAAFAELLLNDIAYLKNGLTN